MQIAVACLLVLATSAHAFVPQARRFGGVGVQTGARQFKAPRQLQLFAENDNSITTYEATDGNIESAAGVTGGILGLIIGGPVFGVVVASISLYLAKKKDSEVGEGIRGVSKAMLELTNFATRLNSKFDVTGKVGGAIKEVVDSSESEVVVKVKEVAGKIGAASKEYGLLDKTGTAVATAAKLSDAALEKVEELNAKYDFVAVAKNAAAAAAAKAAELKEKATKNE